jgi:hypothetical protein
MVERSAAENEFPEDRWLVRDLPADVDLEDNEGRYGSKFHELWTTDVEYEWPTLLSWYQDSDARTRATINLVFVRLVGYTLPSVVDLAHGRAEDLLP